MSDRLESTLTQIERRLRELSDASERALTGNARSLQYGMVVGGVDALNEMASRIWLASGIPCTVVRSRMKRPDYREPWL